MIYFVFRFINRIFAPVQMIFIMKKYLFLTILMLMSYALNAQDKMVLTSGKVINIRVVEVSGSDLKFRLYDNLQGPVLAEKLANIYYVKYENGPMQIFNGSPARTNNYNPYTMVNYSKPYTRQESPMSGFTAQVDLYIQNSWGVGFMLRKEFSKYIGMNLVGGSYMSGWNELKSPKHYGHVNVRLCGVRAYLPIYEDIRAFADVVPGYTYIYSYGNHSHCFGADFSAGFQIHRNVAISYNLDFIANGDGHATYHWGRISFLF